MSASPAKELSAAKDRVFRLALAHPEVGFILTDASRRKTLLSLKKVRVQTPLAAPRPTHPTPTAAPRLRSAPLTAFPHVPTAQGRTVLGTLSAALQGSFPPDSLRPARARLGALACQGFLSAPPAGLPSAEGQFLFVNGRFVGRNAIHRSLDGCAGRGWVGVPGVSSVVGRPAAAEPSGPARVRPCPQVVRRALGAPPRPRLHLRRRLRRSSWRRRAVCAGPGGLPQPPHGPPQGPAQARLRPGHPRAPGAPPPSAHVCVYLSARCLRRARGGGGALMLFPALPVLAPPLLPQRRTPTTSPTTRKRR